MKRSILKKVPVALGIFIMCGLMLASAPVMAGKDTSFTAEHVIISPDGSKEMKSMIYYTPDKMRMEMNHPAGMGKMIVIYVKKDKKMVMLNPAKKAYFEMPMSEDEWPGMEKDLKKEKIGSEKVSGYKCTKYAVVRKMNMMGNDQEVKATSWESDKFAIPLRTKTEQGGVQEIRNIKEGKPPAKVFNIPSGYKRAGNMMQMMAPPKK